MKWLLILFCFVVFDTLGNSKPDSSKIESSNSKRIAFLTKSIQEQLREDNPIIVKTANELSRVAKVEGDEIAFLNAHKLLADYYTKHGKYDSAYISMRPTISKIEGIEDGESKARYYNKMGLIFSRLNQGDSLLLYVNKAITIANSNNDKQNLINSNNLLGIHYASLGMFETALKHYHKILSITENKKEIASITANIGNLYHQMEDWEKAEKYNKEALKIYLQIDDEIGAAACLLSIGNFELENQKYKEAIKNYKEALEYFRVNEYAYGIAICQLSIGETYYKQQIYPPALEFSMKAKGSFESMGKPGGYSTVINNIASIYKELGNYNNAKKYFLQAIEIAKKGDDTDILINTYKQLSEVFKLEGNYVRALEYMNMHNDVKDEFLERSNRRQIADMEAKYETEKKQLEIEKLKKDEEAKAAKLLVQEEELKRQNLQKIAFAGGFLLMLVLAFVVFRSYRQKQKDNQVITAEKENADTQRKLVEEKNKEITDSITYAKRIQEAILPPISTIKKHLPNSFIFYKPKDIVAGDFYWMEKMGETIYLAAADCTGHGVPGAMVSVVCSTALSKALLEEKQTDVGKLLDKTREIVVNQLAKGGGDIKDGMDISIAAFSAKTNQLQWAGANNPLWFIRNGKKEIEEIKPNKQPIGKYDEQKPFTSHSIELEKGDTIYLFSDGFQDQFGGENLPAGRQGGKKYKVAPLKKFILSIQNKDMDTQHKLIKEEFDKWKGDIEQVDDVCIIGVRI